jgi:hypothetical protein
VKNWESHFSLKRFYSITAISFVLYVFVPLLYPYDYATIKTFSSRMLLWLRGETPTQRLTELRPYKKQYIRELNAYYKKNKHYPESLPYVLPGTANLAAFLPLAYEYHSSKEGYRIIFPDCHWKLLYHTLQEGQGFVFTYCDERGIWTASYGITFYKGEDFTALEPFFDTKTYEVYDAYLLSKLDFKKFMELGQLSLTEKGRILVMHGNIWNP